jgi:hypothetical protein
MNKIFTTETNQLDLAAEPTQEIIYFFEWRLKDSSIEYNDDNYYNNLTELVEDFNESFSSVIDNIK